MQMLPSKYPLLAAVVFTVGLAGCSSQPKLSDSLYRTSEVGVSKHTSRCRVLAVREVMLRDDESEAKEDGFFAGIGGAILGATLGSSVGGGTGKLLATEVGGIAGAAVGSGAGSAISDRLSQRPGLEYSVILANGEERTLTQEYLEGDRTVRVGETCRLQMANDGRNRVLPAEGLAQEIRAPQQTRFVD